jgi:hypothetical protein
MGIADSLVNWRLIFENQLMADGCELVEAEKAKTKGRLIR